MKKAEDDAASYYAMMGHKNKTYLLPPIKRVKDLLYKNTDFLGN